MLSGTPDIQRQGFPYRDACNSRSRACRGTSGKRANSLQRDLRDFLDLVDLREEDFRGGTFAPERRASESPIAIACLRLFTFLPERPLLSVPRLRSCIALRTFLAAFFPYLAMDRTSPEKEWEARRVLKFQINKGL